MQKMCVMLTVFNLNIQARPTLFTRAHILSKKIGMSHVFWDSLFKPKWRITFFLNCYIIFLYSQSFCQDSQLVILFIIIHYFTIFITFPFFIILIHSEKKVLPQRVVRLSFPFTIKLKIWSIEWRILVITIIDQFFCNRTGNCEIIAEVKTVFLRVYQILVNLLLFNNYK